MRNLFAILMLIFLNFSCGKKDENAEHQKRQKEINDFSDKVFFDATRHQKAEIEHILYDTEARNDVYNFRDKEPDCDKESKYNYKILKKYKEKTEEIIKKWEISSNWNHVVFMQNIPDRQCAFVLFTQNHTSECWYQKNQKISF
jgi:hypothetical protein